MSTDLGTAASDASVAFASKNGVSEDKTTEGLQHLHKNNSSFYEDDLTPQKEKGQRVRMLELHPGNFEDPISCSLHTVPLQKDMAFSALSYRWQSTGNPREIVVNGKNGFLVTVNLHNALRRLRQHGWRDLWIDAIAINQASTAERNAQVALMKEVYSGASQVLVWLGPCTRSNAGDSESDSCSRHPSFTYSGGKGKKERFRQRGGGVVQEVVLGREVLILTGPHTYDWKTFDNMMRRQLRTGHSQLRSVKHANFNQAWWRFIAFERLWYSFDSERRLGHSGMGFFDVLSRTRKQQVTDVRDKVFGILGIVDDFAKPDYHLSPYELCRLATMALIDEGLTLREMYADWSKYRPPFSSWVFQVLGHTGDGSFSICSRSPSGIDRIGDTFKGVTDRPDSPRGLLCLDSERLQARAIGIGTVSETYRSGRHSDPRIASFKTADGMIEGDCPAETAVNDLIMALVRSGETFVLRSRDSTPQTFVLVGEVVLDDHCRPGVQDLIDEGHFEVKSYIIV